jgi:hypothetical protein
MSGSLDVARVISGGTGIPGVQGVVKCDQSYAKDQWLYLTSSQKM